MINEPIPKTHNEIRARIDQLESFILSNREADKKAAWRWSDPEREQTYGFLRALYWALGLALVGKATFSYTSDELWEAVQKAYPPNALGWSAVPIRFKMGNSSFDCETGSVHVSDPRSYDYKTLILFKREKPE